jgi:hypothetical protein
MGKEISVLQMIYTPHCEGASRASHLHVLVRTGVTFPVHIVALVLVIHVSLPEI